MPTQFPYLKISNKKFSFQKLQLFPLICSYCLLLLSIEKISLVPLRLVILLLYSKIYSMKLLVPMTLKFQRANKKNSTKDNVILSHASSYVRKLNWNNLKSNNKPIFMKKMVKHFGQLQLISFTMLENLKSILSWNSLLAISKLWIGSLSSIKKV